MSAKGSENQRAGKSDDKKSDKIPQFFELYQFTEVDYIFIEVFRCKDFLVTDERRSFLSLRRNDRSKHKTDRMLTEKSPTTMAANPFGSALKLLTSSAANSIPTLSMQRE